MTTLAVISEGDDLVLGLVLVALGDVAEQLAVAIGHKVIEIAQDIGRIGDRDRLVDRAGEGDAGIDDVDGTKTQTFIDLVFVAQLRGRKHADFIAAGGALLDLFRGPQRLRVIRLGDFVNVRPFQFGLRAGRSGDREGGDGEGKTERQSARKFLHSEFLPLECF